MKCCNVCWDATWFRNAEDVKKVYLLGPSDGQCRVSYDKGGQDWIFASPPEITFDREILQAAC